MLEDLERRRERERLKAVLVIVEFMANDADVSIKNSSSARVGPTYLASSVNFVSYFPHRTWTILRFLQMNDFKVLLGMVMLLRKCLYVVKNNK